MFHKHKGCGIAGGGGTRGNTNVIVKSTDGLNELIELVQELDDHLKDMFTSLDRLRPLLELIKAQEASPSLPPSPSRSI